MKFNKPPATPEFLIELLQERGMTVSDTEVATLFLKTVGYYRFTGYALHFEEFENRQRTHKFKSGTDFNDIVTLTPVLTIIKTT
ncbi:MAG: Abi family protein [Victivallaceae bacterium]|nr:Abi family protein [Victivallaceae bacterium]